jgi:hypothetical protein
MYQLSRNFYTTEYANDDPMSDAELFCKKIVALSLGVMPYLSASIWLGLFHYSTTMTTAIPMMYSIKLFSLSQSLVWGKYVANPSGDSFNSRLAQYGSGDLPWTDLNSIYKAIYTPEELGYGEWNLDQWKQIQF